MSFVLSWMDYGNAVLADLPAVQLNRLHLIYPSHRYVITLRCS